MILGPREEAMLRLKDCGLPVQLTLFASLVLEVRPSGLDADTMSMYLRKLDIQEAQQQQEARDLELERAGLTEDEAKAQRGKVQP